MRSLAGYAVTELARQSKQQRFKLGAVYQKRYAEYAPALFRAWGANAQAPISLIDALDQHVVGKPAGDQKRHEHLDALVVVHGQKITPILERTG